MMENRAYEDEPNKSVHHYQQQQHLHRLQEQQHFHQQLNLNLSQLSQSQHQLHPHQLPQHSHTDSQDSQASCEHARRYQSQLVHSHRFDPYRGMEMVQHGSDCHVYEDIVAPYGLALEPGGAGAFHRNLTLPLRRTSQSCESIEGTSSSVRVTNRERTRGSVIDRLNRDDRNRSVGSSSRDESLVSGSSVERPARRRRKKDCKHCKVKSNSAEQGTNLQHQREDLVAYEERNAELRAIFGLPGLCTLAPSCLNGGVVYAIGCNGTDCTGSIVSSSGGGTTNSDSTTTTAVASTVPRFTQDGSYIDDKNNLIVPPGCNSGGSNSSTAKITGGPGTRAAGMKVNSIYAQEHWHAAAKDPRIFLNDPKDQNFSSHSAFQRAYTAVSANSPSSENRANLRRSVRDEPAPHPARLRKHRHGWTLQFGRQGFMGTNCTKSLVLLLILVLTLLGIGGFALYIVFEPEKLHVIQQYLRSNARNSSSTTNYVNPSHHPGFEEPASSTSIPTTSLLDVLLNNNSVNSLNSNNLQGEGNDVDDPNEPVFVTAWTTSSSTTTPRPTTPSTTATSTFRTTTMRKSTTTTTTTTTTTLMPRASSTTRLFLEANSRRRRTCSECYNDEVCVARNADETPFCRAPLDLAANDGCGGLCDIKTQKCHKLEAGAYRCTEIEHHCLDDEWTCHNIFCIPLVKRCDGQMNCYDHSDEYNCECNLETHFHCGNQTSCLPLSKKCDGQVDCFDATDEENCTTSHELGRLCPSPDEYTCRNKQQCIRRTRFCDGYRDCKDGSDEPQGCQGRCNKHEFTCHNGRCINKLDKCNGIDDCGDGSDEQHCRERS